MSILILNPRAQVKKTFRDLATFTYLFYYNLQAMSFIILKSKQNLFDILRFTVAYFTFQLWITHIIFAITGISGISFFIG